MASVIFSLNLLLPVLEAPALVSSGLHCTCLQRMSQGYWKHSAHVEQSQHAQRAMSFLEFASPRVSLSQRLMVHEYEAPASNLDLLHSQPGFFWDQLLNKILAHEFLSQGLLLRKPGLRQQQFLPYLVGLDKCSLFILEARPYSVLSDDLKSHNA